MKFDADRIRERLDTLGDEPRFHMREGDFWPKGEGIEAAVLMPLTVVDGEMSIVLTKRSMKLRKHKGEVSFPGGRRDYDDETLLRTALRETHEEVALAPHDVSVFGAFLHMPTVTSYQVTAYVGEFQQPYDLVPNPAEIDRILVAPLRVLAAPETHRIEIRNWAGTDFEIHVFEVDGQIVWGATGFMLNHLIDFLELR